MPLNRGFRGQSATAERYNTAANGPKCRRRCEGSKNYSNFRYRTPSTMLNRISIGMAHI